MRPISSSRTLTTALSLGLACGIAVPPLAQPRAAAAQASLVGTPELDAIRRVQWRSIGPANQAGRIPLIVGLPGDRST